MQEECVTLAVQQRQLGFEGGEVFHHYQV